MKNQKKQYKNVLSLLKNPLIDRCDIRVYYDITYEYRWKFWK